MRSFMTRAVSGFAGLMLMLSIGAANADEIKFLCAAALRPPMAALIPEFERLSGHNVVVSYGNVGALTNRIQKGEAVDVAIVSPNQIEMLITQGKVSGSGIDVAKVGLGMAVRKGARKPDISTIEALKITLLNAKTIGYNDPGTGSPAGIHVARLAEQWGLAKELQTKTRLNGGSAPTFAALDNGEIEIGFAMVNQIMEDTRVELVGPLPEQVQDTTVFTAAVGASSKSPQASKALVDFLASPTAAAIFKTKGLGLN